MMPINPPKPSVPVISDAQKLIVFRYLRGYSQVTLARLAGVPQGQISDAENGKKLNPTRRRILQDVLGVDFDAPLVEAAFAFLVQGEANEILVRWAIQVLEDELTRLEASRD